MLLELLAKILFTIIFMCSMMILTFVLFRIPIRYNLKQVSLLGILVGIVNFYFKFILDSPYVVLFQITVAITLLMVFRRYPLLFSLVVIITGTIFVSLLDAIVSVGALQLKLTTIEKMSTELFPFIALHLIVTALCLLISYILATRKIGFSFILQRFSGKYLISTSNFIWAIFLILSTVILQFISLKANSVFSLHAFFILVIAVCLILAILYALKQNKNMIRDRYSKDFINKGN